MKTLKSGVENILMIELEKWRRIRITIIRSNFVAFKILKFRANNWFPVFKQEAKIGLKGNRIYS
jgi:hypothetical protein